MIARYRLIPLIAAMTLAVGASAASAQSPRHEGMGPGMMAGQGVDCVPGTGMGPGVGMMGRQGQPMWGGHPMMGGGHAMLGHHMLGADERYGGRHMMGGVMEGRPGLFKVERIVQLSADDVRLFFSRWLERFGNPRLKVGDVTETDDDTVTVDIVTADDSLADRFAVDRYTGWAKRVP